MRWMRYKKLTSKILKLKFTSGFILKTARGGLGFGSLNDIARKFLGGADKRGENFSSKCENA